MPSTEIAVLVESFNETEHSSVDRLAGALELAEEAAGRHGGARVILADGGGNPRVAELVERRFPGIQRISSAVQDYDLAKASAAAAADAQIVVFLDGDCRPLRDDWLEQLTAPIRSGAAVGTAGFTSYEGGWLSRVLSVMDFGFLLPRSEHDLGCYASNNAAFAMDALAETPAPEGDMRCRCYAHAQMFARKGTPVRLAPAAEVKHEAVPLVKERLRRGWDLVTAARVDPELREARWLRAGVVAAPLFYVDALRWDVRRTLTGGGEFGLGRLGRILAIPVMAAVRLVDLVGIAAALRGRPVPGTA
jgi:Glycosyl transferase family 2